jgi:hypothetical protein
MTNRRNENPPASPASEDELRILQDPRLANMPPPLSVYDKWSTRDLDPTLPISGPSRFLELDSGYNERTRIRFAWINEPQYTYDLARGNGFAPLRERPRFEQQRPRPLKPPQIWHHNYKLFVSPEVLDVLCRFDAQAIEFCPIDWVYSDGSKLEGYGIVDIIRLVHAFDYDRSKIRVRMEDGRKSIERMLTPTVLRTDIPPDVHIFRVARWRHYIYVSRELATALAPYIATDMLYKDPHEIYTVVKLKGRKKRPGGDPAPPPAIVHDLPAASEPAALTISERLQRDIPRMLDAGNLEDAEASLIEWLRELPQSPFHVATEVAITTPPEAVATFFNDFMRNAAKQAPLKALYAEMNGFTVNYDRWFFDAFAFETDEGREGYEWLANFSASSDTSLVITGMERLQAIYEPPACGRFSQQHPDAAAITEVLVIVRFQRLLQQALPHLSRKVPLLASAHDYSDYIAEIKPAV